MVELQVGKTYSTKELSAALNVSYGSFKNKKNEFLKNISLAYHYEVEYKGRGTYYTITEKIGDYQKPERKNARKKTDETIKQFINETIDEDPMQTAANINRRAWEHSDTNPSSIVLLGLKESTTGEYIRLNLREMYGTQIGDGGTDGMIERRVWCKLNAEYNFYEEMSPEMVKKFFECFDEVASQQKEEAINIANDYEIGLITKEEMDKQSGEQLRNKYKEARQLFAAKYGYYPIKVPVYIRGAWTDEDKAYKILGND